MLRESLTYESHDYMSKPGPKAFDISLVDGDLEQRCLALHEQLIFVALFFLIRVLCGLLCIINVPN